MAVGAGLLWATMSVLTGVVGSVVLLVLVRTFAGIGRVTNEVIHPSLLTDWYQGRDHPRVFFVHRLANPLSAISGLAAGGIAATLGWQWAFVLLALPTLVLLVAALRLREPTRGATLDPERAADAAAGPRVRFGDARRELFAITTLRRLWLSSFLLGMGAISITLLLSLFYERVYGFGPVGRGAVQFVYGAGTVAGLIIGAVAADRAVARDRMPVLATITGLSGLVFGGGLALMVASPWPALSIVAVFVLAIGTGSFQPAYFPLVGRVSPPYARSQAYAWAVTFVAGGALVAVGLFELGDQRGYRLALGVLAAIVTIAGLIATTARAHVARDVDRADRALAIAAELRATTAGAGDKALTIRGLEVAYGPVQVLFGVDLDVRAGEIVALLGTNGAGKSTLLRAISGVVPARAGAVVVAGEDVTHADPGRIARSGVAHLPGGAAVFPGLTVREHVRLVAAVHDADADSATIASALELFPVLRDRSDTRAGQLSGGEQQMLGIALALVGRPRLLLIDELSLGLAPAVIADLLDVIRRVRDEGTAVLLVEQSVDVALEVADRAYFLERGQIRFEGPARDLRDRTDLLRSVFLDRGARTAAPPAAAPAGATAALEVAGVTVRFGGITAVDSVSLAVAPSEVVGLIGPNGAGKTTLFDVVSGFVRPAAGRVHLRGEDVTPLAPHVRAARGLGRSFQDARLVPSLTVAENIAIALDRRLPWHDHLASVLALPAAVELEQEVAWSVADIVELTGLGDYRLRPVAELSTGTRRIVDVAMAIAHAPSVMLLDEPSAGIAQREVEQLGPLLLRIREETGCALVVIEHDVALVTAIADRLVALHLGRVLADGPPQDVLADPQVVASYLGRALSGAAT